MDFSHLAESLSAIATLVVIVIGFIVWLALLGGRITRAEKDIEKLEKKHDALESLIFEKLSKIEVSLGKIEGRLSIGNKDN